MVGDLRIPTGVIVVGRVANFLSATTGLQTGDVIHGLNGKTVDSLDSLRDALRQIKPHDAVVLQVEREGGLRWLPFEME
jgi:S1-C subfamily serine protease